MIDEKDIPEHWRRLGYSGVFHTEATLEGPMENLPAIEARMPYESQGFLVLKIDRSPVELGEPPVAVLVRKDAAAICDLAFGGPVRRKTETVTGPAVDEVLGPPPAWMRDPPVNQMRYWPTEEGLEVLRDGSTH